MSKWKTPGSWEELKNVVAEKKQIKFVDRCVEYQGLGAWKYLLTDEDIILSDTSRHLTNWKIQVLDEQPECPDDYELWPLEYDCDGQKIVKSLHPDIKAYVPHRIPERFPKRFEGWRFVRPDNGEVQYLITPWAWILPSIKKIVRNITGKELGEAKIVWAIHALMKKEAENGQ